MLHQFTRLGKRGLIITGREAGPAGKLLEKEGPPGLGRRERSYFRAWYPHEGDFRMLCVQAEVQSFFFHKGDTILDPTLLLQTILQTQYVAYHKK